ncbi:hypothetical protein IMCC26134_02385 [Verrucomicrobia bacterium IMCC26134]|nr:hypothetical protein IMCC26134_02385 [Verrucomicrobia bacterium IMCC26134]
MATPTPLQQLQEQADVPQTKTGKLFTAMPVIMTVIATLLAGLASGEMTKAQYDRAFAAQLQSKAGDQWAFFQAKRLRGELQRNTIDVLTATGSKLPSGSSAEIPKPAPLELVPEVTAALDAARADAPPETINPLLQGLADAPLAEALKAAKDRAAAYDTLTAPLIKAVESVPLARLTFNAARYDAEAKLVADIARLYEIQVRKTNLSAERHHLRSQRFFFGMLAAQAAVIVSTFALAARQRNLLWGFAAGAGVLAVVFAIYVYVYV